jgi:hypothetical protein
VSFPLEFRGVSSHACDLWVGNSHLRCYHCRTRHWALRLCACVLPASAFDLSLNLPTVWVEKAECSKNWLSCVHPDFSEPAPLPTLGSSQFCFSICNVDR